MPPALPYQTALGVVALFDALFGGLALWRLMRRPEMSMASFQLEQAATRRDFDLFLAANVVLVVTVGMVGLGTLGGVPPVVGETGQWVSAAVSLVPGYVFFRWWRRFR